MELKLTTIALNACNELDAPASVPDVLGVVQFACVHYVLGLGCMDALELRNGTEQCCPFRSNVGVNAKRTKTLLTLHILSNMCFRGVSRNLTGSSKEIRHWSQC